MNDNISKNASKSLVVLTASTMTSKIFPGLETILLLKVDNFEGFLNRCKTDGMVNDNSSSCNS